jgi:preprotein translocase subunit SecG
MESLVIFVHVIAAIGITGLVLIQHGKGADMGASFGSGASQTIFGSVGSANALTKSTSWLATIFFVTSLVLALFAKQQSGQSIADEGLIQNTGVLTEAPAAVVEDVPVADSTASDIPQAATTEEAVQEADPAPAAAERVDTAEQESAIPPATETAEPAEETPVETDGAPAQ